MNMAAGNQWKHLEFTLALSSSEDVRYSELELFDKGYHLKL